MGKRLPYLVLINRKLNLMEDDKSLILAKWSDRFKNYTIEIESFRGEKILTYLSRQIIIFFKVALTNKN